MKARRAPGPRALGLALLLAGGLLLGTGTAGAVIRGSALALPILVDPGRPRFELAQRAIDRSWGLSEDSTYSEVDVPEWRSEGLAAGLSAVVPGAGQVYAGEGRGVWFALAELAGWTVNRIYVHNGRSERDRSVRFAGDPTQPGSAWSFERFRDATPDDASAKIALDDLQGIWERDPEAFYELIARDTTYLSGWNGPPAATRDEYSGIRGRSRDYFDRASTAGYVLWINHLVAAFDALRAARLRNLTLQRDLELKLSSSWRGGCPAVRAALVRRF